MSGDVTQARISGLRIVEHMPANGIGIDVIGGCTLTRGATSDSMVEDVHIEANRLRATGSGRGRCLGITLVGDWTDFHAGMASGGRVDRARVTGNLVEGCKTGLMLAGAFAREQVTGRVHDSSVSAVQVERNRSTSNGTGVLAGGTVLDYSRIFGQSPTNIQAAASVWQGNSVHDVVLDRNVFEATRRACC